MNCPVIVGSEREEVSAVKSKNSRVPKNFLHACKNPLSGLVLMPPKKNCKEELLSGIPDNNRCMIFPDIVTQIDGRGYALAVKGVGAKTPLYGSSPLDFAFPRNFGEEKNGLIDARKITNELWFGESPYGAQGEICADYSLKITELANGCNINGFYICPVIEVNEFPEETKDKTYWYRRYLGQYLQEQRLMPSNIRLYHQSELTLGRNTAEVLNLFNITTADELDGFIDNYISSGVAALTLFVRTMEGSKFGFIGLDYTDVWLDKDSVLAPDGTIHFADIEGLEWVVAGQDWTLEERVRFQFERNFYEFMYCLDILLRERARLTSSYSSIEDLRSTLAIRLEIALARDSFLKCESSKNSVNIVVKPPIGAIDVPIRVLDLR
ncbi:MAG: hypothetical protein AB1779_06190 [Candidatus Thermoplasmatota archaeon]